MITLITGGVKSGKTTFALKMGSVYQNKLYIATAEAFDEEMQNKIQRHKDERDKSWSTIEEPIKIYNAIKRCSEFQYAVLDCITVWVNNLFYYQKDVEEYLGCFLDFLEKVEVNLTIVTNEIGLGLIPSDKLSRDYTNTLGFVNQKIASAADRVIFMVSGLPIYIKK